MGWKLSVELAEAWQRVATSAWRPPGRPASPGQLQDRSGRIGMR